MIKKIALLSLILTPSLAFCARLGSLSSNAQVALSTEVIKNQNTLQDGATFYVSSGTVNGYFYVNSAPSVAVGNEVSQLSFSPSNNTFGNIHSIVFTRYGSVNPAALSILNSGSDGTLFTGWSMGAPASGNSLRIFDQGNYYMIQGIGDGRGETVILSSATGILNLPHNATLGVYGASSLSSNILDVGSANGSGSISPVFTVTKTGADVTGTLTVGGVNVCQQDGINCPPSSVGSSALAVASGSLTSWGVPSSSPTSALVMDQKYFSVVLAGGTTAFATVVSTNGANQLLLLDASGLVPDADISATFMTVSSAALNSVSISSATTYLLSISSALAYQLSISSALSFQMSIASMSSYGMSISSALSFQLSISSALPNVVGVYNTQNVVGPKTFYSSTTIQNSLLVNLNASTPVAGITNSPIQALGNVNGFLQVNIQNFSTGTSASGDLVITANNGGNTTNYVNLGINSNTYNQATFTIAPASGAYLYSSDYGLAIGAGASGIDSTASLIFFTSTTVSANERMRINNNGSIVASSSFTVTSPQGQSVTYGLTAATVTVNDDAYAAGWDGSNLVPTKNAVYDKIQTLGSSSVNISSGPLFSSTNTATVTNSSAETSVRGYGYGSSTFTANQLYVGETIMVYMSGLLSDDAVTPGTLNIKLKIGGTTVAVTGAFTPTAGLSNSVFELHGMITVRSIGATGSVMANTLIQFKDLTGFTTDMQGLTNTAVVNIDTTKAINDVDATVTWGTADTDNVFACTNFIVDVFNGNGGSSSSSSGGGGYFVEPASVTFRLDKNFTAGVSTGPNVSLGVSSFTLAGVSTADFQTGTALWIPRGTSSAPFTNDGSLYWDSDDDALGVGTGSAFKYLMSGTSIQVFLTTGTYTPHANMISAFVIATGGGGSGQICDGTDETSGGGGAGGTAMRLFTASEIGASQSVSIGIAASTGNAGAPTSFGSFLTANGGAVGLSTTSTTLGFVGSGGIGGTASGGHINVTGGDADSGYVYSTTAAGGGTGGSSYWGGGGRGAVVTISSDGNNGTSGKAYGSGGGGCIATGTTDENSGSGAAGTVMIIQFLR